MNKTVTDLVRESKKRRLTLIPNLTDEDITRVWDAVCQSITSNYMNDKGTTIKNFGTFQYIPTWTTRRPCFTVSEKNVQMHRIKQPDLKVIAGEQNRTMKLNYSELAVYCDMDRDSVELCVKEVVSAWAGAVARKTNVKFLFTGIGVLNIDNLNLKFKFFNSFIRRISRTDAIKTCLYKRPGTADSIMSDISTLSAIDRPHTSTFCLPRMNSLSALPPIEETEEVGQQNIGEKSVAFDDDDDRETIKPHQVTAVEMNNDGVYQVDGQDINFVNVEVPNRTASPRNASRPMTAPQGVELMTSPKQRSNTSTPRSRALSPILPKCASPLCANKHGQQELCYLCMQRSTRNIAVNYSEERKRKEMEQSALLQQYQQMKDTEAIIREKEKENENRNLNRKVAAYNLGIAEGIREEKLRRPKTGFEKSYVFQERALTPSRKYNQHEYGKALETQVKIRNARQTREKHDRKFQEKLEQAQLAEDLANQREQFLRTKAEQVSQYQKALSAQVRNKPLPMPQMESDSKEPIFGRNDATNEKLLEKKMRAHETLRTHLEQVAEKRHKNATQHMQKIKQESEMLKRTREELIADRVGHHKRSMELRKSLETNWRVHHDKKMKKLQDERMALHTPGKLLLQQTEHYRRCAQCQRGVHNCGETNIWSESRYIPGSRLMV